MEEETIYMPGYFQTEEEGEWYYEEQEEVCTPTDCWCATILNYCEYFPLG